MATTPIGLSGMVEQLHRTKDGQKVPSLQVAALLPMRELLRPRERNCEEADAQASGAVERLVSASLLSSSESEGTAASSSGNGTADAHNTREHASTAPLLSAPTAATPSAGEPNLTALPLEPTDQHRKPQPRLNGIHYHAVDAIEDYAIRNKVEEVLNLVPGTSVQRCFDALARHQGSVDKAATGLKDLEKGWQPPAKRGKRRKCAVKDAVEGEESARGLRRGLVKLIVPAEKLAKGWRSGLVQLALPAEKNAKGPRRELVKLVVPAEKLMGIVGGGSWQRSGGESGDQD
ncbi:hypothetical protein LTR62_002685 [Meristemomyces frigidus]|uniref:Uncharacterized protein n=1 Tax=Meristemomyces frigidus TaxID=1508187 RepID=A0AAN7YHA9_9PEZI|nr:hypothetical protein LTR62_002685 [Meristemomyces frigidus]